MYKIKSNLVESIKDGRTNIYLAKQLGLTANYVGMILGGYKCTTLIAKALISMKEKINIDDDDMEELLKYYFDKI